MAIASPTASKGTPKGASARAPKPQRKNCGRVAGLIAPALIVLAVIIGYPIIRAIVLSFQGNRQLNPQTGLFEEGGFAGLENYLYWINNRCVSGTGQISTCPPGVIATDFWPAVKITLFFTIVTVLLETILGMLMAGMNFKKILGYRRLWLVTALRLVGIPLAAVALLKLSGLAHLVPDGQTILLVSLLATCTPSASTITQMAQIYGKDADYASAINVVTTLLCIFTMPLMVALYQL